MICILLFDIYEWFERRVGRVKADRWTMVLGVVSALGLILWGLLADLILCR